jgi:hypothetical protein
MYIFILTGIFECVYYPRENNIVKKKKQVILHVKFLIVCFLIVVENELGIICIFDYGNSDILWFFLY